MADYRLEVALPLEMSLGESPLWSQARQTLYWVDINHGTIYAWRPGAGMPPETITLDEKVGCVALCEGGLLGAASSGLVRLRLPFDNKPEPLAANPEWHEGHGNRFNDGGCDPAGRFWVGTIDADATHPTAALYSLEGGELVRRQAGIGIANGLAFSPDRRWLYHTDSLTRRILRYPFDAISGSLGEPHPWVDLETLGLPGVPDGAAVDSEGHYWSALYGGGKVVRFSPEGEWVASIEVPCPHPTMPAFGGADLRTLYITTATQHLDAEEKRQWPAAGSLLCASVEVAGLAEPCWSGA
ncbi:SMP-30/gluconolactonase/LRE family protein [Halomonas sp. TRM85114]|uniref:SMP-30/gluconolactonase/LRE family protein n=1 Tax=Halomonas jincaotanensis TaxID=2810616 RepID=UPI001BD5776F|nr:SMP-30/gluconolactonase/LRE family protein [Halomonas jincaotanensis]MBS9403523.1 SMP-30/gluconolactonase/LRE family protein [Halomonas jincaotanensis]